MDQTWADLYTEALAGFGGTPLGKELEAELVEIFEQRPEAVRLAIADIGAGFAAGRIRSPWGALRAELARQEARTKVVATGNAERDKRIQQAEQYMRAAGLYLASEDEVLDDLFGERGRLRAWSADDELRERMLELWRSLQPAAARVEAEALERAENWKRGQAALRAPLVPEVLPIDWPPPPDRQQAYAVSGSTMRPA